MLITSTPVDPEAGNSLPVDDKDSDQDDFKPSSDDEEHGSVV